jgi:hypothetical protein
MPAAGFPRRSRAADRRAGRGARHAFVFAGLAAAALAAACSADGGPARPSVDVGATTAAVAAPPEPVVETAAAALPPADNVALPPAAAGAGGGEPQVETAAVVGPMSLPPEVPPEDGGFTTGLPPAADTPAAAPSRDPAEPPLEPAAESRQPLTVPAPTAAPKLVAYPRFVPPKLDAPAPLSGDEVACRRELRRIGVVFRELPPINDGGACYVENPVKVLALSGGIGMQPPATLNCEMALAFARWTKDELAPAARWRYFSGLKAIHQASSYSCRNINGTRTSSEHSRGNALDVARFELNSGRDIDVRKPGLFAFRQRGFLNTVRADGCSYFTTVLGPGYNWDHRNHFHFDIKPRRNGHRACR